MEHEFVTLTCNNRYVIIQRSHFIWNKPLCALRLLERKRLHSGHVTVSHNIETVLRRVIERVCNFIVFVFGIPADYVGFLHILIVNARACKRILVITLMTCRERHIHWQWQGVFNHCIIMHNYSSNAPCTSCSVPSSTSKDLCCFKDFSHLY